MPERTETRLSLMSNVCCQSENQRPLRLHNQRMLRHGGYKCIRF